MKTYRANRAGIRSTTIVAVRREGRVAIAGDGQVSLGATVMKQSAVKIRRVKGREIVAGFAGSTADALTLFDKFEGKIEEFRGNITRASVDLAKEWRTDKMLRKLEALLIVADIDHIFVISGSGDVIEPEDGIAAVGSGGSYAIAAARVLKKHTELNARAIVEEALKAAAEICIYTNDSISIEEITPEG